MAASALDLRLRASCVCVCGWYLERSVLSSRAPDSLSKAGTSRRTVEQSGVAGEVHGLAGPRTGPSVNPRKQPVLYPTKCKLSLYAKQRDGRSTSVSAAKLVHGKLKSCLCFYFFLQLRSYNHTLLLNLPLSSARPRAHRSTCANACADRRMTKVYDWRFHPTACSRARMQPRSQTGLQDEP